MTHTPGPWRILRHDLGDEEICFVPVEIRGGNGKLIVAHDGGLAPLGQEWTVEDIEANGSLIEAAPDMLEALEEVVAITENLQVCPFCGAVKGVQSHRPDCLSHEINATIRKARGGDVA